MSALVAIALAATACGQPSVPVAASTDWRDSVVTVTALPVTPTPEPTATTPPTPEPEVPVIAVTPTPVPTALPGITADRLTLAMIYDDQRPNGDGTFAQAIDGIEAWVAAVNLSGGIAGREVEVQVFNAFNSGYDDAFLTAFCDGDVFAVVGSHSFLDYEHPPVVGTEGCALADFPGAVYSASHAVSAATLVSNPFLNDVRQAGPARYLAEQFPEAAENLALFNYNRFQLQEESLRLKEMLTSDSIGMQVVFEPVLDLTEDITERIVPEWTERGAQSLVWSADPERLIALLDELEEPPVFVLCEVGCYSEQFIRDGGELVEGVYAWVPYRPFGSESAAAELATYQAFVDSVSPGQGFSQIAFESWMAGRLFEEAMSTLTASEEVFGRHQLLDAARSTALWSARGVTTYTDPVNGVPTPCFALVVVRDGEWVQEYPDPVDDERDLDCAEDNLFDLIATAPLGLIESSATSSEQSEVVEVEEAPVDDEENLENPDGASE